MIMVGDVPIDLFKPSFHGLGNKISNEIIIFSIWFATKIYIQVNYNLLYIIDYKVILKYQYLLIAKYNNV